MHFDRTTRQDERNAMKRLMMFLLTLAMVCTMGVISFAEGNIAPHDLSPEPIIPDVCSHLYSFKYATSVSETDPKTGRTYTVTTEYYVCTNCGAEYIVTTYK